MDNIGFDIVLNDFASRNAKIRLLSIEA
jgi:hypothetical protein